MRLCTIALCVTLLACAPAAREHGGAATDRAATQPAPSPAWDGEEAEPDYRKEWIAAYSRPLLIDTFFWRDSTRYRVMLRHYCTFDSGLTVPARYNEDIRRDFVTHHFRSRITLLADSDTVFSKHLDKYTFNRLLFPALRSYATLLSPELTLQQDSIQLRYSISIPVTDVGIGATITFAPDGQYSIRE